jgi:hypothetical protein
MNDVEDCEALGMHWEMNGKTWVHSGAARCFGVQHVAWLGPF